jgi:hypothetical protein
MMPAWKKRCAFKACLSRPYVIFNGDRRAEGMYLSRTIYFYCCWPIEALVFTVRYLFDTSTLAAEQQFRTLTFELSHLQWLDGSSEGLDRILVGPAPGCTQYWGNLTRIDLPPYPYFWSFACTTKVVMDGGTLTP